MSILISTQKVMNKKAQHLTGEPVAVKNAITGNVGTALLAEVNGRVCVKYIGMAGVTWEDKKNLILL